MIEPRKYRKQPVVIEAVQLTRANASEVMAWCGGRPWSQPPMRAVTGLTIPTPEGDMAAPFGHWVIKGVAGEFCPCKPEIFAATYEPVGVEVVERGAAQELREALEAIAEWPNGGNDYGQENIKRFAQAALRRPVGVESEAR